MNYKPYKEPKIKKKRTKELRNNVLYNERFSPVYCILIIAYLHYEMGIPFFSQSNTGAVGLGFLSTLMYLFASNYFQPDLDVLNNRPGMGHFPIGRWSQHWKIGRFFRWFLYPLNRFWYYLWQPYASLLTHRGAGHIPIWGVWIRVAYLLFWTIIFNKAFLYFGIKLDYLIIFIDFLKSFYPWSENFLNLTWVLFCFPIYFSDIVHIVVDYKDSHDVGYSFCPPEIPRGLITKTIRFLKGEEKL